MNSGKYVFAQLLQFINRYEFEKCVKRYNGNYCLRHLSCWNQFVQLFFGQLSPRNTLANISNEKIELLKKLSFLFGL